MKTLPREPLTYAEHAVDITTKAAELIEGEHPFALVTSLAKEGGATREIGSLALVESKGQMTS